MIVTIRNLTAFRMPIIRQPLLALKKWQRANRRERSSESFLDSWQKLLESQINLTNRL
jgi:hypothetical protein